MHTGSNDQANHEQGSDASEQEPGQSNEESISHQPSQTDQATGTSLSDAVSNPVIEKIRG